MEIEMSEGEEAWLHSFISYEYNQHCAIHTTENGNGNGNGNGRKPRRLTFFCKDYPCCGPLCKQCVSLSHSQHTVFQVRKTSRRDSINRDVDIRPHMTHSCQIFPYTWNNEQVFFLRSSSAIASSSSSSSSSSSGVVRSGCCKVCERRFHEEKEVLYCSIECKYVGDKHDAEELEAFSNGFGEFVKKKVSSENENERERKEVLNLKNPLKHLYMQYMLPPFDWEEYENKSREELRKFLGL